MGNGDRQGRRRAHDGQRRELIGISLTATGQIKLGYGFGGVHPPIFVRLCDINLSQIQRTAQGLSSSDSDLENQGLHAIHKDLSTALHTSSGDEKPWVDTSQALMSFLCNPSADTKMSPGAATVRFI